MRLWKSASRPSNRRNSTRFPVGFYIEQIIQDDLHRSFTTDISPIGLYMERVASPLDRRSNVVQLEIPLPHTSDAIWAKGEVIYDRFDALFHGTAVRFTGMARNHQRLLREWLRESEKEHRFSQVHPFRASQIRVRVSNPTSQCA